MQKFRQTWQMLSYNFKTLIEFQLIFKIISLIIFTPIFIKCFNLIMNLTGYKYLTLENISNFLLNPLTIILLLILILVIMVYSMFDITTIIIILDASYNHNKIKILDIINISLKKCQKMFTINNIPLAFLTLFIIPFLNIGVTSSYISTIKIPEFINEFIIQNAPLLYTNIIITIILIIILLRWIYSLHYYILEDTNFKEARKRSIKLSKHKHLKDLLALVSIQIISSLIYFIFIILGIILIFLLDKIFGNIIIIKSIIATIIWIFIALSLIIYVLMATPISYAIISSLYYLHKKKNKEKIIPLKIVSVKKDKKQNKNIVKLITTIYFISLILGTIFTYGIYKGEYNLNIEYVRTLEVTAHRGSSIKYPENTILSFIKAKKEGADWIELDVQQTKDKEIIVLHDTNLKRTTGLNKEVWKTTYNEIKMLDAGSYLSKKYKDERIPLLKDVIIWAKKNNMKLNIELKPTGNEKDFEKAVVDIINEFNYTKNCVITSQSYNVLEEVKKYNPKIETVYVMSIAYGNITYLDKADHFSVEASNANENLVTSIHKKGKKLYVWTVNTEENIRKMIDLNVDNIVTDNITLAKDIIYKSKTSDMISEYIKIIDSIF